MKGINANLLENVKRITFECGKIVKNRNDFWMKSKAEYDFVTSKDIDVSNYLIEQLPKLLPTSIVVSEEEKRDAIDLSVPRWIVDPIDGTTNFIYDYGLYAISIGLIVQNEPVLGVVYNPATNEMFSALEGYGAFLNEKSIHVNMDEAINQSLILVDTNPYGDRDNNVSFDMIKKLFLKSIDIRVIGSAALSICYVACGRSGAFVAQSLKPWDIAGACAILRIAGGKNTDRHGKRNCYLENESIVASNMKLHSEILATVKRY